MKWYQSQTVQNVVSLFGFYFCSRMAEAWYSGQKPTWPFVGATFLFALAQVFNRVRQSDVTTGFAVLDRSNKNGPKPLP